MKRLIQRVAALTAALCLAAACMAPVYAETANTEKEENVYVSLAGDGSVADIYIVNMFALDGKTEIRDYGAYSSVRNLTSEADISLDGDSVTVSAEAGTFYYQGNLKDAQLPWNISVAYMLDGKNVAADELAGANGHLVISGSVTKNKLADGDFYEAYMVQATVLLDTVKCRNIQTEGATEANVGADKQLSYMKLPGQDLSFTIETDVTDFSMEGISLNAVPLAIHMEKPDTSELDGQIDDLQDGAQQLDDGAKELAAGAQELNSGAAAVASGAASLVAGANTLSGGAAGLAGATSELSSGLSLLAGQSAALQSGAGTIFDSLLSAANTQLENLLTRTSLSYTPMTRENYAAVLADVQQQIGGAALKAATEEARAKVTAEVTAAVQVQVEQQATRAARAQAEAEVRKQEQPIRDGVTAAIREQVKASITEEQIFSAAYENVCTQPGAENMTEEEKRGAAAALAASEREALLKTVTDTAMVSPEVQQQIDTQVENEVQKQVDAVMAMPETQAAIQQQIDGQMVSDEVHDMSFDMRAKPFDLDDNAVRWVNDTFNAMTQEEKIAQLFVDMLWNDTGKQTAALLGRYPSGGLRYNNRKPRELYRQNAAAQKNSRIPLLIAANVEAGGNGAMTGGTKIGEGIACAATGDTRSAYEMGLYGCREAAAVGCNWTFAPVVDIDRNWRKSVSFI